MKIAPLLLVPVSSLETASTTATLLSAVGRRNVTHMEALIQGLADESTQQPGWKLDPDVTSALQTIRNMFVKSIQTALKDQHRTDQNAFNCFTKDCFGECNHQYSSSVGHNCHSMDQKCHSFGYAHDECRAEVYASYKTMAKACGELHCFDIPADPCPYEECLCPDVKTCHTKTGYDGECVARTSAGDCPGQFGKWLKRMITKYTSNYDAWLGYYQSCSATYSAFLKVDLECDKTQRQFEQCLCDQHRCEDSTCNIEFMQCSQQCWDRYEKLTCETECLEHDRKIDWSATKKIECFLDVLLHDYTKEELLSKCGTENCINDARSADYKECHTICTEVDHDAEWPEVVCTGDGHCQPKDCDENRTVSNHFLLGDDAYDCDINKACVFTQHRSTRGDEKRCTEHLDIDYQIPNVRKCTDPSPPICDESFLHKWYAKFDDVSKITCINDCCPDDTMPEKEHCHAPVDLETSYDGENFKWIHVTEHTNAWAYNRCPCQECGGGYPVYTAPPDGRTAGCGAHTIQCSARAYR